jgi:hypothetical protein
VKPVSADVDQLAGRCELPALTREADALIQNAGGEKRHEYAAEDTAHAPIVGRGEGGRNFESRRMTKQGRSAQSCGTPGVGFVFFS